MRRLRRDSEAVGKGDGGRPNAVGPFRRATMQAYHSQWHVRDDSHLESCTMREQEVQMTLSSAQHAQPVAPVTPPRPLYACSHCAWEWFKKVATPYKPVPCPKRGSTTWDRPPAVPPAATRETPDGQ